MSKLLFLCLLCCSPYTSYIFETAHIGEAKAFAETLVESEGLTYINGYDDPPIIAGAGTMGMEIVDEVPCVDAVVVPVGGAGKTYTS